MIKNSVSLPSMYSTLGDMLNIRHPLYQLANKINWVLLKNLSLNCIQKKVVLVSPFDLCVDC